jgi:predicted RNase H-like nuclease (RuvC/YqgF family)
MMGISFDENGSSAQVDFTKFCKFLILSDNARTSNLDTIENKAKDVRELRSNCLSLKNEIAQMKSNFEKQETKFKVFETQSNQSEATIAKSLEMIESLEAQLQEKNFQLEAKNQEIARIQAEAAQHSARFSKTAKFCTSPRVLYPVGTVAVLEVAAHQTQIPQVAPSYWVRRGLIVVGKIPSKMWQSIFDANEPNSTNSVSNQQETISSKIEAEKPLFDLSSNTAVQGVPPVTPPFAVRPCIPFFSFTLLM